MNNSIPFTHNVCVKMNAVDLLPRTAHRETRSNTNEEEKLVFLSRVSVEQCVGSCFHETREDPRPPMLTRSTKSEGEVSYSPALEVNRCREPFQLTPPDLFALTVGMLCRSHCAFLPWVTVEHELSVEPIDCSKDVDESVHRSCRRDALERSVRSVCRYRSVPHSRSAA